MVVRNVQLRLTTNTTIPGLEAQLVQANGKVRW